jgi:hypothetical protein
MAPERAHETLPSVSIALVKIRRNGARTFHEQVCFELPRTLGVFPLLPARLGFSPNGPAMATLTVPTESSRRVRLARPLAGILRLNAALNVLPQRRASPPQWVPQYLPSFSTDAFYPVRHGLFAHAGSILTKRLAARKGKM